MTKTPIIDKNNSKVSGDGPLTHESKQDANPLLVAPPYSRVHVTRGFGHPWTREPGWDLLEISAESEGELDKMIIDAERKFWSVWIRDNTGRIAAVLYKPTGATSAWSDPGLANRKVG